MSTSRNCLIGVLTCCGAGGGASDLNVQLCHTDEFVLGGRVFIVDAKTTEAPDSAVFFPPLLESAGGPMDGRTDQLAPAGLEVLDALHSSD